MEDNEVHKNLLNEATQKVIRSKHPKKILIAGPGAGKTTGFLRLLEDRGFDKNKALVFTFLGILKKDLEEKLTERASVFTFHGYCLSLLKSLPYLGGGITNNFAYLPDLTEIIKGDWKTSA